MRQRRVQRPLRSQVAAEQREGIRGHGTEVASLEAAQGAAQGLKLDRGNVIFDPAKRQMRRKSALLRWKPNLESRVFDSSKQVIQCRRPLEPHPDYPRLAVVRERANPAHLEWKRGMPDSRSL